MAIRLAIVVSTPDVAGWPYGLLSGTFSEKLHKAHRLGYDGVELLIRDPSKIDVSTVTAAARSAGIQVAALNTGGASALDGLSLTCASRQVRLNAMKRLESFVDLATEWETMVDIGLMRGRLDAIRDSTMAADVMLSALGQIGEYAAKKGVKLTLEPINRYETDCVPNADEGLRLLDRLGSPAFGLLLDTFHMNIEDKSFESSIRHAGHLLWHMHVADSNRLAPGCGHVDFGKIVKTLQEIGYEGYMSLEALALPDPDRAAAMAVEHLRLFLH